MTTVEQILTLFETRGDAAYFGEPVSQTEHALQAAWHAEREGAPDSLVVAALLHDCGHLLHGLSEGIADEGVDGRHETVGEAWLMRHFGAEITEPVRLHVAAKRYLSAVEPEYGQCLSPASIRSLELQGGPMTEAEVTEFEQHAHHEGAVRLRRWDDLAKIPNLPVPGLAHYRTRLQGALREG